MARLKPELVAFCDECETFELWGTHSEVCPGDHSERPDGRYFPRYQKRYRKRRMYVCHRGECDDRGGFFDLAAFEEHLELHEDDDRWEAEDDDFLIS